MRRLMLAGAVMAAVGCASEPSAAVKVSAHKVGAEGAGDGHVESPPSALHPLTPTDEALATSTTTTEPAPVTTTPTTVYEAVPSPQGRSTGRGSEPPAGDVWASLADCESGGNAATNTGNGYYGAFQFSLPTWRSVGETGLPSDYSYSHQRAAAQRLQARSGWGQWPACSRKLGLR